MKHLLRKLFFWDASVVKGEPYPGLLFATMLLAIPSPLFLCWLFCCRQFLHFTERVSYGMVMVLGLFVYSLAIKYIAVGGLFKDCFRRKLTMAVCLTVFVLFDWLLLGFLSFRRRKPLALLLSVAVLLLSIFSTLGRFQQFQWLLQYDYAIGIASLLCVCGAILVLNGGFSRKCAYALIPLALCLLLHSAFYIHRLGMRNELAQIKTRIASLVGDYPTEVADYRRLLESGDSLDEEPLKSLILATEGLENVLFPEMGAGMSEVREKYNAFVKDHPDFVDAVRKTMNCPPHRIAHKWKDDCYTILLPELGALRKASRFLAMEMKANATDRDIVASRNKDLISLRDCALENTFFISRLVGIAIEAMRLDAITFTLPYNDYSLEEFEALLGEPPDWNRYLARAHLDEAIVYEGTKDYLLKYPYSFDELGATEGTDKMLHIGGGYSFFGNLLDVDLLLSWRFAERVIGFTLAEKRFYPDIKEKMEKEFVEEMERNGALLCMMLWPATGKAMEKMDLIKDSRRMALLAWQVMNYSHRNNGMLPESIEVLGEVPVDSVNGLPFEYRHGNLEFDKLDDNEKMRFSGFWIAPADPDTEWRRPSICVPLE